MLRGFLAQSLIAAGSTCQCDSTPCCVWSGRAISRCKEGEHIPWRIIPTWFLVYNPLQCYWTHLVVLGGSLFERQSMSLLSPLSADRMGLQMLGLGFLLDGWRIGIKLPCPMLLQSWDLQSLLLPQYTFRILPQRPLTLFPEFIIILRMKEREETSLIHLILTRSLFLLFKVLQHLKLLSTPFRVGKIWSQKHVF